jgi:glutamyl-tRNA synthetase
VAAAVLSAYDNGDLAKALEVEGGFKKWANALGKAQKRKGKRLLCPCRLRSQPAF